MRPLSPPVRAGVLDECSPRLFPSRSHSLAAVSTFLHGEAVWDVADSIPNGSAAAIALLEHRWAIPLRDAIIRANGRALADTWVHPADLVAVGVEAAEAGATGGRPPSSP